MSIIVLSDVILDECVFIAGASGRQTRKNDRIVNQAGYASVNVVRDATLREFMLGVKPMLAKAWQEIEGVYEITDAGAFGFLVKDPKDQEVGTGEGQLQGYMSGVDFGLPGFGNGTALYGLRKIYKALSSSRVKERAITRPINAPLITRGGTPVTYGLAPGNISISGGPSYIAFVPDATRTVTAITVGATTVVTLSSAIPGLVVGGRLWLQNLAGADAALLNGKSHKISDIAGAVYTLVISTIGKSITAAGQAHKYPQPDEALVWTGSFYVPVQFAADEMDWDVIKPGQLEDRLVQGTSVTLVEVREA